MEKTKLIGSYLVALSVFLLALSIFNFTYQISAIDEDMSLVLKELNKAIEKTEPILKEAELYRIEISKLLNEAKEIRVLVPKVTSEVSQVRQSIPSILRETEEIRKLVPSILKEASAVRKSAPSLLDKANLIVINADKATQKAGEGAVAGIFTGIIKTPFKILKGVKQATLSPFNKSSVSLEEYDRRLILTVVKNLYENDMIGVEKRWENPQNKHSGSVTYLGPRKIEGETLFEFVFKVKANTKAKKIMLLRLRDDKSWEIVP